MKTNVYNIPCVQGHEAEIEAAAQVIREGGLVAIPTETVYGLGADALNEAAVAAIDAGDTSAAGLASYKAAMEGSFVIQDLRTFSKWPHVMEEWGSMFTDYPVMVKEVFNAMFSVDGAPQRPLMKRMRPIIKKRGMFKLGREVMKAVKAL